MKFKIGLWAILLLVSCNNMNKSPYPNETKMFQDYLGNAFTNKIQTDSVSYILVPSNACLGCIGGIFAVKDNLKPDVVIIASEKATLRNQLPETKIPQLLIDATNEIDKLPFHKGNIGQLKCANGEIYSISSYDATQMEGLIKSIKKD